MNIPDLVTMLDNLSLSLGPVQTFLKVLSFILGLVFFVGAIQKFKKIGEEGGRSNSHQRFFAPVAYLLAGSALIYLPTTLRVLSTTAFGSDNILAYGSFHHFTLFMAIQFLLQTIGLVWLIRGCSLLAHAGEPGALPGTKGLAFLTAGVFLVNFNMTMGVFNYLVSKLVSMSFTFKNLLGY
jgi:hypothetical protein